MSREWNDKLERRLQDSIWRAARLPRAARLLVTDLENSEETLIEVLAPVNGDERVVAEFLVRPSSKPKRLRYREEQGWPK